MINYDQKVSTQSFAPASKGSDFSLRPYQQRGVEWLQNHPQGVLACQMGSGKTAIVSRALPDVGRIVIVAPLRVCASVWPRELNKWAPGRSFVVLQGSERYRKELLHQNADITILNYELVPWAVENGVFTGCRCLVLDELSRLKGHQGSTFKALRRVLPKIPVRWGMTGTLISQGVIDAWAQTWCLDLGARLGRSFTSFIREYLIQGREYWDLQPQPGAEERIAKKIRDLVYRIEPAEYADTLPPLVIEHLPVTLPAGCLEGYRRLARDMTLGPSIFAGSRAVLTGKLQQYAQGAVYPLPELGERQPAQWFHHAKLDAARAFLDDLDEPCIVVYQFLFELEALRETNKGLLLGGVPNSHAEGGAAEKIIHLWNEGALPVLYMHPRCLHPSTEILTEHRGWRRIVDVRRTDRVFDGVEFVSHEGCVLSGVEPVLDVFGVKMTAAHRLLVNGVWETAEDVRANQRTAREARYSYSGNDPGLSEVFTLRNDYHDSKAELCEERGAGEQVLPRMPAHFRAPANAYPLLQYLARNEDPSARNKPQERQPGIRARSVVRALGVLRELLRRHVPNLFSASDNRAYQYSRELLARELPLGYAFGATGQQANLALCHVPGGDTALGGVCAPGWNVTSQADALSWAGVGRGCSGSGSEGVNLQPRTPEKTPVYDLVNCGPRHRFVIRNDAGEAFVSHNSGGHGLNLQTGGRRILWLGPPWSLDLWLQVNARLHRSGAEGPTVVTVLMADGTVDLEILAALEAKGDVAEAVENFFKVGLDV